ncbi:MAG: (Fe-S)-binding protein, partial [Gammaproteobacteria bacterium]|nr:(Fe-S)-binding protein [Gammaproteobacteria bacterium]
MSLRTTYPDPPKQVYFFGTCLVDMFYPEAGLAGMELIRREGITVIFPQDQTCCGQPAYNSGTRADATKIAKQVIRAFESFDYIVAPSGSCAGMLKKH